jgi:Flp pilus assembly protein TadB
MLITLTIFLVGVLLFLGFKTVCTAASGHSYGGHRTLKKMSKWRRRRIDVWAVFPLKQFLDVTARFVFLDETSLQRLRQDLSKVDMTMTPQEFTAKKYLIIISCFCLMALSYFLSFYMGIVIGLLAAVYDLMKQRDSLNAKVRKTEQTILQEMPRFVRAICRSLHNDRDLYNVISAYRKVAGPEIGGELDILLAEMKAGNIQSALVHFENRLGTPEAFRLCGALQDMSMGIDQTATLGYIADDMAHQVKENIRKELSLRPGKMRRTYYPAIGICIAMILYVLVVYVINNFNNLL